VTVHSVDTLLHVRRSAATVVALPLKRGEPVISIRRISLGGGFRYLMESVAAGDGAAEGTSPLTRYYVESGTPPGLFLGSGLPDLDGGRGVESGLEVTQDHLRNMLAACADPVSGEPVGSAPKAPRGGAPVAGFDLTFSPSKSISVAWALADEGTKAVIYGCHRRAIDYVLSYAEAHVLHSRSGTNGIVEEDITGAVAASFAHWASRTDDPQLHDHVVVWNRGKAVSDGRWRTLDSRAIFKATTTLSELHQGVLSDLLTTALGVGWEARQRRHSTKARFEITGVPETLMAEFSRRSEEIDVHRQRVTADFVTAHGRQPTAVEQMRLRQWSTIATRGEKSHRTLAELTDGWRERADDHVHRPTQVAWVASLRDRNDLPLLRADDLDDAICSDAASAVVETVAERHSTYGRQNLLAEVHRVLHGVRFASPDDRVAVAERIGDLAVEHSVLLTPPSRYHQPERYRRADGSSRLDPTSRMLYTTEALLEAEARLLAAGRAVEGPVIGVETVAHLAEMPLPGRQYGLSMDQAVSVEKIATSGRSLDVLVGPAGTGKSTTMAGLRAAWETEHGAGSVIGLAPSATAAEVLAEELGVDTENTAKWLTEWRRIPALAARRDTLAKNLARHPHPQSAGARKLRDQLREAEEAIALRRPHGGQLVIVDEASLAGTFALDELVAAANEAGAKVLLVGDWAQLTAVEAGGAFSMLVSDRGDFVPELTDVRRFKCSWEKAASGELRRGHESAFNAYEAHDRIAEGNREEVLGALYAAWRADIDAGRTSVMIAPDSATVGELNRRARADLVAQDRVADDGLELGEGRRAGGGDEVVTRQNSRVLTTGRRWVKNGDRWVVTATHEDGSMVVKRKNGMGEVVLPADYVASHVDLAYATTAHRAQGATVDTAHALISPTTTREVLYVAATRGTQSNRLYVNTSYDPDPATSHDELTEVQTMRDVLARVLENEGADLSAHVTRLRARHHREHFATLAAEYQTLAQAAQAERFDQLLEHSGLTGDELQSVRTSEARGALLAGLRDAESQGQDIEHGLRRVVAAGGLDTAEDVAAVLHARVDRWIEGTGAKRPSAASFIAGLIPRASSVTDPDLARALDDRATAMEWRARQLAKQALDHAETWSCQLGPAPTDPVARERWMAALSTIAAYRERWGMKMDSRLLGPKTSYSVEHESQRRRSEAAANAALSRARQPQTNPPIVGVPLDSMADAERGVEL
jgi:conjugative relaxase-like TrwC/TraI family protein